MLDMVSHALSGYHVHDNVSRYYDRRQVSCVHNLVDKISRLADVGHKYIFRWNLFG